MRSDLVLMLEIAKTKQIAATKEIVLLTLQQADPILISEWRGQEIAFAQLRTALEDALK